MESEFHELYEAPLVFKRGSLPISLSTLLTPRFFLHPLSLFLLRVNEFI